jgi:hypothetical protein
MRLRRHNFRVEAVKRIGKGTVCFDSMLQRWQAGEESPTVKSYSAPINAWGYEGDASRAEIVLQQMQDDYPVHSGMPHNVAFNTAHRSLSRTKSDCRVAGRTRYSTDARIRESLDQAPARYCEFCVHHGCLHSSRCRMARNEL